MEGIYFCSSCVKVIHQNQLPTSNHIICPFCHSLEVEIYNRENIETNCLTEPANQIVYSGALNHTYDMLFHQINLLLRNDMHIETQTMYENDDNNYIVEMDNNSNNNNNNNNNNNSQHYEATDEDNNNSNYSNDESSLIDTGDTGDTDYTDETDDTNESNESDDDDSDNDDSDDDYESSEEENEVSIYVSDGSESYISENDDDTNVFYWLHRFHGLISEGEDEEDDEDDGYENDNEHEDDDDDGNYSYGEHPIINEEDNDGSSSWETLDEGDNSEEESSDINDDSDDDGFPNLPELLANVLLSRQLDMNSLPDAIILRESIVSISNLLNSRFRDEGVTQSFTLLARLIEIHFSQYAESNSRPAITVDFSKLKQRNLKDDDSLLETKTECIICKEIYEIDISVVKMQCGHEYHQECLNHWLKQSPTCPVCRQPIDTMDDTN
ncbi:unnamed protein product [Cunninghamella blakesleeana]